MDSYAALADPTRRAIVSLLASGERPAGAIAREFAVSAPAISQHLKALRDAGLVGVERRGQQRIYRLDPAGLAAMERWLAETRRTWIARLDALERALEQGD